MAPQAGHVHRLVERADVHRPVAEVADGDAIGALIAQRVRGARGESQMSADDAVAAVQAVLGVEQVHRAALALRDARALAEELGHDLARIGAEDERLGVIAIAAEDDVVVVQRAEDAGGDRLLADVDVEIPADLALTELALGGFLEAADEDHLPEQVAPFRRARRIGDRGTAGFFLCFCHRSNTRGRCTSHAVAADSIQQRHSEEHEGRVRLQRAVEGDGVVTTGAGVAEADEVVGEVAGAGAVGVESFAEEVAVFEGEQLGLEYVIDDLRDPLAGELVARSESPDHFAEHDIIDEQVFVHSRDTLGE